MLVCKRAAFAGIGGVILLLTGLVTASGSIWALALSAASAPGSPACAGGDSMARECIISGSGSVTLPSSGTVYLTSTPQRGR